ncbi:helix-hairpin-helix domain-containing protein [Alcaligenaceae bacterium CGII-47]|nr:helix-hairpin-helix domain-containing protein [Alcaligenaceae bacterium CGII-47]
MLSLTALAWSGSVLALDLNTATEAQLKGIRGIGPKTAQIILQERERGGRYESFSDLSDRVKGIGPKKADALQAAGLAISSGKSPVAPAGVPKR